MIQKPASPLIFQSARRFDHAGAVMLKRWVFGAVLLVAAGPLWAQKMRAGAWLVDVEARGSKLSGNVTGRHCKVLLLDIYTTRWGHAVVEVKNVGQSRKFFSGAAAVYGRGPAPQVSSVSASCQD